MKMEFVPVGRIVNAHGVRGEVRVLPMGQTPVFLTRFRTFYRDGQAVRPTANHVHGNCVLMKLPGVEDRDAALQLKDVVLSIRREDAHLGPLEAFDQELLQAAVYDADTGEKLGVVAAVEEYPAHRVLTVRGEKTYLIPAVPEVFIRGLDLDANRMDVHLLEGMETNAD